MQLNLAANLGVGVPMSSPSVGTGTEHRNSSSGDRPASRLARQLDHVYPPADIDRLDIAEEGERVATPCSAALTMTARMSLS